MYRGSHLSSQDGFLLTELTQVNHLSSALIVSLRPFYSPKYALCDKLIYYFISSLCIFLLKTKLCNGKLRKYSSLKDSFMLILCMWLFCLHIYTTLTVCLVITGARRGCQISWAWRSVWWWAAVWVLGAKAGSSARAMSAPKDWAISSTEKHFFLKKKCKWKFKKKVGRLYLWWTQVSLGFIPAAS